MILQQRHKFASAQETLQSMMLTDLQRNNVENSLLDCIQEKLSLSPETFQDTGFLLKHEFLRGQITMLEYLLALDENARTASNSDT